MLTTKTLQADLVRKSALDDYENKIRSAFRRGLEATCIIAEELHKIYSEDLWTKLGYDTWAEYLEFRLRIDQRNYRRINAINQTVKELKEAGLALPDNDSQAAELSRLEKNHRAAVWNDLLIQAEKTEKGLTAEDVKKFVEKITTKPAAPSTGGIEVEMGDSDGGEPKTKPPAQEGEIVLSEKGEAALARIRKICGDTIADAIEDGSKAMTEREIKGWADHDDEMMRTLVYYLIDRNWTLNKAVSFATKNIQDSTDVGELILIASARGGKTQIEYGRAKIIIELT